FATTCGTTTSRSISCFYALGFGLGFATTVLFWVDDAAVWLFLCPRFRAGLCDPSLIWSMLPCRGLGFYALGFGLGFVTIRHFRRRWLYHRVSMPSVSGWAL